MNSDDVKGWATLAAVAVGGFLLWRGIGAIKGAAGAVGGVVSAADQGTADTVGSIGAVFGLPTNRETVADPRQVRWLIDHAGHMAASKWGTASAYLTAAGMRAGSGDATPPPAYVLAAEGIEDAGIDMTRTPAEVVGYITGGATFGTPSGPASGLSFNDVLAGKGSNPFFW